MHPHVISMQPSAPIDVIIFVLLAMALFAVTGCARIPMVRECGATTGAHGAAQDFAWVQTCGQEEHRLCNDACRPAINACEADLAEYRDPSNWNPHYVNEDQSKAKLMRIQGLIEKDCKVIEGYYR